MLLLNYKMNLNSDYDLIQEKKSSIGNWFNWIFNDTVTMTDSDNIPLCTCTRTQMSWKDYQRYGNTIRINDFLTDKLNLLLISNRYIETKLMDIVYCTFDRIPVEQSNMSCRQRLQLYIEGLKTKGKHTNQFNMFDYELCGTILGGVSILCLDTKTYWRLWPQIKID